TSGWMNAGSGRVFCSSKKTPVPRTAATTTTATTTASRARRRTGVPKTLLRLPRQSSGGRARGDLLGGGTGAAARRQRAGPVVARGVRGRYRIGGRGGSASAAGGRTVGVDHERRLVDRFELRSRHRLQLAEHAVGPCRVLRAAEEPIAAVVSKDPPTSSRAGVVRSSRAERSHRTRPTRSIRCRTGGRVRRACRCPC